MFHAEVRRHPRDHLRARVLSRTLQDSFSFDNSSSLTWFTGVPGIGKSMFLLYYIYRFLPDDRFPDKSFAVELVNGEYLIFEGTADATKFMCHSEFGDDVISKKSLLLCDVADGLEPVSRAKKTFIFTSSTSPPPKHFYELLKGSPNFRYIMPTWSEQEFMFAEADVSQWYNNFVHYGGVPRLVFSKLVNASSLLLQEALIVRGEAIVECLFKYGYEYEGSTQNFMVVHANPPVSRNGYYQYNGDTVYSFASDYIFKQLVERHSKRMLARAATFFDEGIYKNRQDPDAASVLFKKVCLWLKPFKGQITAASVGGTSSNYVDINIPVARYDLPRDWVKNSIIPLKALMIPRNPNHDSGDAFFVVENGFCSFKLMVFHITVDPLRTVNFIGLQQILQAFPTDVRKNITERLLVYVVPKLDAHYEALKLVTHEVKGKILPDVLNGFQQSVYLHGI